MLRKSAFGIVLAALLAGSPADAQDFGGFGASGAGGGLFGIFDEVRLGTVFSVQDNDDSGVIVSGQIFSKPFVPPFENYFLDTLLRPRVMVGGNVATGDDPINQVYAALAWTFPVFDRFFLEASFGGTLHDGPLNSAGDGLDLGCHLMFRESVGVGVNIGQHFRLIASADHSSHADLCDGGNSGITHAGVYGGYRF